jgi:CDP-diacylglycerol--glycerol-3-phosphate 3-phosphatidyltransferase
MLRFSSLKATEQFCVFKQVVNWPVCSLWYDSPVFHSLICEVSQLSETSPVPQKTFSDRMRVWFRWYYQPIATFLNRLGIRPNAVTIFGLIGTLGVAVLIALGEMTWAGILLLIMGPVDVMDGALARLRNEASDWGAFVDSVTDRYSELFIYGGFLIYYLLQNDPRGILLSYLAASGSVLVSYIKARADASKLDANGGLLTRVERYLVLIPGLIFNIPLVALLIIGIFAHLTAVQRIWLARADAHRRMKLSKE